MHTVLVYILPVIKNVITLLLWSEFYFNNKKWY